MDLVRADEVEASRAIFGDEYFTVLNENEGVYKVTLFCDVPVTAADDSRDGDGSGLMVTAAGQRARRVQHVPPLDLHVFLPELPGEPIQFSLHSQWLNGHQLSSVLRELDAAAELDFTAAGVVFLLATWLKENLLPIVVRDCGGGALELLPSTSSFVPALDPQSEQVLRLSLQLRQSGEDLAAALSSSFDQSTTTTGGNACDDRASSTASSRPEATFAFVQDYDLSKRRELFGSGVYSCALCFESNLQASQCTMLRSCGCVHCSECVGDLIRLHVKEGSLRMLRCPACSMDIDPTDVGNVIGATGPEFQRYERLLLQQLFQRQADCKICPECEKPVVLPSSNSQVATCIYCKHAFCTRCFMAWHGLAQCPVRQILGGPDGTRQASAAATRAAEAAMTEEERAELRSITVLRQITAAGIFKPCPSCSFLLEKMGGCNKVHCDHCGNSMCWHCGEAISSYAHFNTTGGNGARPPCPTYPVRGEGDEARQAFARLNVDGAADGDLGQQIRTVQDLLRRPCPRCEFVNVKLTNDNLIRCGCSCEYCILCATEVFGPWHWHPVYHKRRTKLDEDILLVDEVAE